MLLGDKQGDNGQVFSVAAALGWDYELKQLHMLERYVLGKPRAGASLQHIDRDRSDPLEPPWPDLILTIGLRPSNVALWIKQQSGGRTRIVLLGKPSGRMKDFDLIVASAENHFPRLSSVLPISLPLMRVDAAAVAAAATAWRERFAGLPRPLVGIMVGGPTGPYTFKRRVVDQLVSVATDISERGGTPYFTTSRRTPAAVVRALKERLPAGSRFFEWSAHATDNPYLALLGSADGFLVTGDSISMMVEIVRLRKPLAILDLPTTFIGTLDQSRRRFGRWLFAPAGDSYGDRLRAGLGWLVYRSRIIAHTRDFRAFHRMLIDSGLAVRAGQAFTPPTGQIPDDTNTILTRIRQLASGSDQGNSL